MSFGSSAVWPDNPDLALAECWYWIRKLQARFFAGDYASAIEASSRAQRLLWTSASMLRNGGISLLRRAVPRGLLRFRGSRSSGQQHLEALAAHHRQLEIWAANCPENFENRAALVGAEIARIEGRDARCDAPLRTGHPLGPRQRLCPQRGARQRTGRALLRGAWLREDRPCLSAGTPATAICVGEPMARCGNSIELSSASQGGKSLRRSDEHDRGAGRTARSRDRDQSVAGRLGRDRPGEADRDAHADRDRACRRRARPADPVPRATSRGSRRKPRPAGGQVDVRCARRPCHRPSCRNRCSTTSSGRGRA